MYILFLRKDFIIWDIELRDSVFSSIFRLYSNLIFLSVLEKFSFISQSNLSHTQNTTSPPPHTHTAWRFERRIKSKYWFPLMSSRLTITQVYLIWNFLFLISSYSSIHNECQRGIGTQECHCYSLPSLLLITFSENSGVFLGFTHIFFVNGLFIKLQDLINMGTICRAQVCIIKVQIYRS